MAIVSLAKKALKFTSLPLKTNYASAILATEGISKMPVWNARLDAANAKLATWDKSVYTV